MSEMEVAAWRVRGCADDWLLLYSEAQALNEATNENLIQPLVTLTSAQAEIERLAKENAELRVQDDPRYVHAFVLRAEAAEKERDALREALDSARDLPIADAELVRMNNSAVGIDEVRISSRMLLLLVGLAMSTRSALQPLEPHDAT